MNSIKIIIAGTDKAIGKTQLAEHLKQSLQSWTPKGVGRPELVIVDGEHQTTVGFHVSEPMANTRPLIVVPGYESLADVLGEALDQAQDGKGAERHNLGGDLPFEDQRMQRISQLIGSPHGMAFQVCKKVTEGLELPELDRQVRELLGAINYVAGIVIFLRAASDDL